MSCSFVQSALTRLCRPDVQRVWSYILPRIAELKNHNKYAKAAGRPVFTCCLRYKLGEPSDDPLQREQDLQDLLQLRGDGADQDVEGEVVCVCRVVALSHGNAAGRW